VADPFALLTTVWTAASSAAGGDSTVVSYEIQTRLNKGPDFVFPVGTGQVDTADGVHIVAEEDPFAAPGVFAAVSENAPHTEANVGVVVMVASLDGNGATADDRQFAFYCSRLLPSCVSVYGDSAAAFKPFATVRGKVP
jgi:hypothetical protein